MSRRLLVTGTDTGCGKTWFTLALARRLAAAGARVACFKPVASGAVRTAGGWQNADAQALQQAATVKLAYQRVNPLVFEPAIAPHLAAARAGVTIDLERLADGIASVAADWHLIEGVGGWMVPLGERAMLCDLVRRLDAGVVLVVGMRLGCINHALMSVRAIRADDCRLLGWVANWLDPEFQAAEENLHTLVARIDAPLLGQLDHEIGTGSGSIRGWNWPAGIGPFVEGRSS